jgi:transcriptional regulator with GAF, ATPase, and Fis domain
MKENEFFRQATLKICGNLNIEESIFMTLQFLRQRMPVTIMFLEYYDINLSATRTIAKANPDGGNRVDLITPLSPKAKEWAFGYLKDFSKKAYLYQDPWTRPYASEMMRFHNISLNSVILLPLESGGYVIGSLIVGCESEELFTEEHADLISMLSEPFAVAMSNAIRYSELVKLKNLLDDDNKFLYREIRKLAGEEIVGANFGLREVMEEVQQVAALDSPVLLLGETGVGKDVIANTIHYSSSRRNGPFIKINCGAIPETLIDSELFGHEKGAFTGAISQKRGCFERAINGTLFLDEIGELPLQAQVRFLRVLQDKTIERVGGGKGIQLDVRIIAATNKDLQEMVKEKKFREDLWFRLNVFPIAIPPLRERKVDIPALLQYSIERKSVELKLSSIPKVVPGVIEQLIEYEWPGNVRELQNLVERELILNPSGPLEFSNFPVLNTQKTTILQSGNETDHENLDDIIREHIKRVLLKTNGKIHGEDGAAQILGINASTLRNRMNKLGIKYKKKEGL